MNIKTFRPMLAADLHGDLSSIRYPVLCSPKFDGIRCLTITGVPDPGGLSIPCSRSLKQIPNNWLRRELMKLPSGLDGEIVTYTDGRMDNFHTVQSKVMSELGGFFDYKFHIFDSFDIPDHAYQARVAYASKAIIVSQSVVAVNQIWAHNEEELQKIYQEHLEQGFEGIIVRDYRAPYKYGRATVRQGWMVKMKQFKDAEAKIVGVVELMHNKNNPRINQLGYKERSSHEENMVGGNCLGAFICQDLETKEIFKLGTGFSQQQRDEFWANKAKLMGEIVKYRHQSYGRKEAPRTPSFVGIRSKTDMDAKGAITGRIESQGELI